MSATANRARDYHKVIASGVEKPYLTSNKRQAQNRSARRSNEETSDGGSNNTFPGPRKTGNERLQSKKISTEHEETNYGGSNNTFPSPRKTRK